MNKDLQTLIKLQEVDLRIHELIVSKEEFPHTVEKLEGLIREAEEKVRAARTRIEDIENEKKHTQEQVVEYGERLKKSQQRLNSITSNREYEAVHAEIETNTQGAANAKKHLEQLDIDREKFESALEDSRTELEQVRSENQPRIADLKEKISSIDSNIAAVEKERDEVLPTIAKSYLRTYEYIRKRKKDGRVLSYVKRGERACSLCHKLLENQILNEMLRGNRMHTCQSCGAILILDESAPQQ